MISNRIHATEMDMRRDRIEHSKSKFFSGSHMLTHKRTPSQAWNAVSCAKTIPWHFCRAMCFSHFDKELQVHPCGLWSWTSSQRRCDSKAFASEATMLQSLFAGGSCQFLLSFGEFQNTHSFEMWRQLVALCYDVAVSSIQVRVCLSIPTWHSYSARLSSYIHNI